MKITTIGIDLAKEMFWIYGVDAHGKALLRNPLRCPERKKFFTKILAWKSAAAPVTVIQGSPLGSSTRNYCQYSHAFFTNMHHLAPLRRPISFLE